MLRYTYGYNSDIPISTLNQLSYILLNTFDVRKRMGMRKIPNAAITLLAAAAHSKQGKTARISDRPVHARCAALTYNLLPGPNNFSCATVHSHFITMHFTILSFAEVYHVEEKINVSKTVCNQHKQLLILWCENLTVMFKEIPVLPMTPSAEVYRPQRLGKGTIHLHSNSQFSLHIWKSSQQIYEYDHWWALPTVGLKLGYVAIFLAHSHHIALIGQLPHNQNAHCPRIEAPTAYNQNINQLKRNWEIYEYSHWWAFTGQLPYNQNTKCPQSKHHPIKKKLENINEMWRRSFRRNSSQFWKTFCLQLQCTIDTLFRTVSVTLKALTAMITKNTCTVFWNATSPSRRQYLSPETHCVSTRIHGAISHKSVNYTLLTAP
jgi:hypothetical protein